MPQDTFNNLNDNGASGEGDGRYDHIETVLNTFRGEIGNATQEREIILEELLDFLRAATLDDIRHLEQFMIQIESDIRADDSKLSMAEGHLRGQDTKLAKRLIMDIAARRDAREMAAPAP